MHCLFIIKDGSDCEIQEIAKEDSEQLVAELDRIAGDLTDALLPTTEFDTLNNCQLEITPLVVIHLFIHTFV